jgi:hypothetical protein
MIATLMAALVAAGPWVGAADEPPSLDQIKGDLKTVKPGAAPELTVPATGPILAAPLLLLPAEEPAPPLRAPSTFDAAGKKRAADPDWLVHAMTESRTEAGSQRRSRQIDGQPSDLMPRDSADPNFLLKVYRAQEIMEREKRDASAQETLSSLAKPGDVGSFSDLLQRWISPGGLSLFGLESGAPAGADGGFSTPAPPPAAAPAEAPAEPPRPNPFLDAAQPDTLPPGLTAGAAPPPDVGPSAAPPALILPDTSPATTQPDLRPDTAASPPARPADEKKYFPQLDRF